MFERIPALTEISQELGISHAALREQLEVARAFGLVEVRPKTGIRRHPYTFAPAVIRSMQYAMAVDDEHFIALAELRKLNLPAVLKLVGPKGRPFHLTLKALQRETATLALGSETAPAAIEELSSLWKGEYTLLWRPPPQYGGNMREGDGGPAIKWLESRLRRVQGKAVPLRKEPVLDAALVERVKKYQLSKGLKPDGVVGPRTLILLSTDASGKMPLLMKKN